MNFVKFILLLITHILVVCEAKRPYQHRSNLIGGVNVKLGNFKYVVGVVNYKRRGRNHCGGGIIDDRFVITAAHCIYDNNQLGNGPILIVAGTNNMKNRSHPNTLIVEVNKVYVPIWDPVKGTPNDIAVLRLKTSLDVEKNQFLEKLRLPNSRLSENLIGKKAVVAGFGTDNLEYKVYNDNYYVYNKTRSSRLHSAAVRILNNSECREHEKPIDNSKLCARLLVSPSKGHYGICSGDSGSPLVYNSNILIGVVGGNNAVCDEQLSPTRYTRVSYYINFIENAMKDVTNNMYTADINIL